MDLTADTRREMFWNMLLARRLDERAWMLHRQGKIAFHISGIGHETAQVGAAYVLRHGYDWIVPYYRDLALMLCLGYTPRDFILALMGKREDRTSGGRQMPSHWSLKEMNVLSHSSPVGTQATQAVGVGLGIRLSKEDRVVLTTIGEGATAQGDWYEAVNWAAIHKLPVVFNVQNNQYAISETVDRQMAVKSVAEKACGLGLNGVCVDGNDLDACYAAFQKAFADARAGLGPTLVETLVYRITPHSSDDDDRSYRTREEVESHRKNDGLVRTRNLLEREGVLAPHDLDEMEARIKSMLDDAVAYAEAAPYPSPENEFGMVYAEAEHSNHG
jgi:2-oxoisovalerate dehydrogenase E1 component alpha subunit